MSLNWYEEQIESGAGKSSSVLYPVPGKKFFCNLPAENYVPGLFTFNGRLFAAGNHLYEIFSNGFVDDRGALNNPNGKPAAMSANQANQLLIASGGNLFVFNLSSGVLTPVDMTQLQGKVDQIAFTDGYFVALIRDSNTVQFSTLLDGLTWPGVQAGKIEVFPDNIVSLLVSFREVWVFGSKKIAVFEDTGEVFPYSVIPSGFLESGCGAQFASVNLDNSVFWIEADERGSCIARRANGYNPQRVSTHAIEFAWSQYPRIDDAVAYAYQDQGHSFWVIYFPSAPATWVYDAATSRWHQRAFWDYSIDRFLADRSRNHAKCFGKHLVGDWRSGNIYEMSINYLTDVDEVPIRRIRRAPHLSEEDQWIRYRRFQLSMETGLGPQPTLTGPSGEAPPAPYFFQLIDVDGQLWDISIDDNGGIITTLDSTSAGSSGFGTGGFGEGGFGEGGTPTDPTFVYLNDSDGNTTSWQVGIDITGHMTSQSVTYSASYQKLINLSTPGNHLTALLINQFGNLQTKSSVNARGPIVSLRYSNDGGHTWSDYYDRDAGQAGEYKKRVIWRRLGRARDRVFEISTSDPFPARIIDAFLKAE